jgi:BMFP domain-containing protein YqiC
MNNKQVVGKALKVVQKVRDEVDGKYRDYLRIGAFLKKHGFDVEQMVMLRKRMDELDDFKFKLYDLEDSISKIVKQ